jgi:hypothetical protein
VANADPFMRAWRMERRRKQLGSTHPSCVYCGEDDLSCLERDHPVTEALDAAFWCVACRNDHRKLELTRDVAHLTHNGRRAVKESKRSNRRRYLLLLAQNQEKLAEVVLSSKQPPERLAAELRATADSLRRQAAKS